MKKKNINPALNLLANIALAFSIVLMIAAFFSICKKCTNKEKEQIANTMSYHSDKGLVTEDNGYITIKR